MRPILLGFLIATVPASAWAAPAVLVVPDGPTTLFPAGAGGECSGLGGQDHSALGCSNAVDEETQVPAFGGDIDAVLVGIEAAVANYDVMVTTSRPPDYVPYFLIVMDDRVDDANTTWSCTDRGSNCTARKRNDLGTTVGAGLNCVASDPIHQALHLFGRLSGLEPTDSTTGAMGYPPDYTAGISAYDSTCAERVGDFNDEMVEQPLVCTSADHTGCGSNSQQNSAADLMVAFGPRTVDTEPPVLSDVVPPDGSVFSPTDMLPLGVTITDADPIVAVRWTVQSEAYVSPDFPDGIVTKCTNDVCTIGWAEVLKPTDSDWSFNELVLPAEGEYAVTLEASDFHGNVAEPISFVVHVGDVPPGTTTGPQDTGDQDTSASGFETGEEVGGGPADDGQGDIDGDGSGSEGSSGGGSGQDGGVVSRGCGCAQSPPSGWLALLLAVTGLRRPRRALATTPG